MRRGSFFPSLEATLDLLPISPSKYLKIKSLEEGSGATPVLVTSENTLASSQSQIFHPTRPLDENYGNPGPWTTCYVAPRFPPRSAFGARESHHHLPPDLHWSPRRRHRTRHGGSVTAAAHRRWARSRSRPFVSPNILGAKPPPDHWNQLCQCPELERCRLGSSAKFRKYGGRFQGSLRFGWIWDISATSSLGKNVRKGLKPPASHPWSLRQKHLSCWNQKCWRPCHDPSPSLPHSTWRHSRSRPSLCAITVKLKAARDWSWLISYDSYVIYGCVCV